MTEKTLRKRTAPVSERYIIPNMNAIITRFRLYVDGEPVYAVKVSPPLRVNPATLIEVEVVQT